MSAHSTIITINIPNQIGSTPIAIAAGKRTGTIIITIDKVSKTKPIATKMIHTTTIKKAFVSIFELMK